MNDVSSEISVTGEFTPDPAICTFRVNRPLTDGHVLLITDPEQDVESPLVQTVFDIEGISALVVGRDYLTVTKAAPTPWPLMARQLVPAIKKVLQNHDQPIAPAAYESIEELSDERMNEELHQVIQSRINPALEGHGGFISLQKVQNGNVYIEMGGGCQGCSASQATLRLSIDGALREAVPCIRDILDVTDHEAGENPYYTS